MRKKSSKTKSKTSTNDELQHRPPNPRQYRPKKSSRNPVHKRIGSTKPIEQTIPDRNGSCDQILQCTTAAPREEIVAQIKIENEYQWGLEAEDFDDLNPYIIEVKLEPDPANNVAPNFEWVTIKQEIKAEPSEPPVHIKQEELDLEDIAPNYTLELPAIAISQEEIEAEPPEQPIQIKQEELDLTDNEHQNIDMDSYPSSVEDDPIETIVVDDDESEEVDPEPVHTSDVVPGDAIEQVLPNQKGIATICVDDSEDEAVSIEESNVGSSVIQHESLKIVHYKDADPAPPLVTPRTLQKSSAIHNYEHKCVPRRIYHNSFLKRFIKTTTYRGYSVRAARILNGAKNQFTHIYACDNCDKLCANHDLIKQHVLTHNLKKSKKHPQLFVTTECQICFQRNLDDPDRIREHLEQEHSKEVYKAAKGQKFSVRIECRICRRWFPMNECLECGEKFDRCFGITWHTQIHRRAEKKKMGKLNFSIDKQR
ncbi:uncharacterized protein LOC135699428 [Ochlerotatus camptorhynchus]|uniref:uncharacterized protein LOC135699428 n=1 Tax=Ochlerotatus camptorhynchus TaxID=644619 RepID=UPI0031D09A11